MKIAKKVLALVMALAMVFALSAMAFADETTFVLSSADNGSGVYSVTLSAKNAEGLKTVDGIIKYDADVLEIKGAVTTGEFATAYGEIGESVMPLYNTTEAGKVDVGIAVANKILPDTEYKKLAEENDVTTNVTTANIALCTVKFTVKDSTAKSATVTYTDNDTGATIQTVIKFNASSSSDKGVTPPTAAESKAEAAAEAATKTASKAAANNDSAAATNSATPISSGTSSSGNKSTGDNMALAIAAGVVVLAGAAFIFTKKRK
jgi:LPXTG-motif cell wall-anchored protein